MNDTHPSRTTIFNHADGTALKIHLSQNFKTQYRDEYTEELIPTSRVEATMQEEIDYFNDRVWVGVPLEQALADTGSKIINTRWVLCNKGDSNDPDVRARLVAQEISTHEDHSFYAATPLSKVRGCFSINGRLRGREEESPCSCHSLTFAMRTLTVRQRGGSM